MPTPLVSVIIPAYNAAHTLAACLDSVVAQDTPADVIVVDDGSTDRTEDVLAAYRNRLRVIRQAHAGAGAARNAGLNAATGAYLAFLDADDFWRPGFLRAGLAFLTAHPEAIAVSTGGCVRLGGRRERLMPAASAAAWRAAPFLIDDFFAFWARHDHVRTGTVILRADVARRAGGQRADLWISQDLEYWAYLATFGPWGFIPEVLWVGNSRAAARVAGWRAKYAERRQRCPTVEAWESRVAPRLPPADLPAFRQVRGRVAAGYLHARILGGDPVGARAMLAAHAADLPRNRVTTLLRIGHALGPLGWRLACRSVAWREARKTR